MKRALFAATLAVGLLLTGCSEKKTDEEKIAEALQSAFKDSGLPLTEAAEEGTPESELREVTNFVTVDLWNAGFVDVSSYINRGKSSTGQTLDIDFTMERLGKAMEKKLEYDTYISGLGTEYEALKPVWDKLSNESDRLYEYLQHNPPEANDEEAEFDTGIFQQYRDAFRDDVDAIIEKAQ